MGGIVFGNDEKALVSLSMRWTMPGRMPADARQLPAQW